MKYLALTFVLAFLTYSCESSDPVEDTTIVEVVDESAIEEEAEEETEETDRWANFVHSSMTIQPYYYPNSEIEYSTDENGFVNGEVIAGDKLVFYYYEAAGDKIDTITGQRLADSAYQIGLLFEIDSDEIELKLENVDFIAAATKFKYDTNTPDKGYFNVTDGVITGTKISETEWDITADFTWTIPETDPHDHADIHIEYALSSNFIPEPQD